MTVKKGKPAMPDPIKEPDAHFEQALLAGLKRANARIEARKRKPTKRGKKGTS